jgi:hypothetical protein
MLAATLGGRHGRGMGEQAVQPGTTPVSRFLMTGAKARWVLAALQSRRSGEVVVDVFLAPERAAEKDLG